MTDVIFEFRYKATRRTSDCQQLSADAKIGQNMKY